MRCPPKDDSHNGMRNGELSIRLIEEPRLLYLQTLRLSQAGEDFGEVVDAGAGVGEGRQGRAQQVHLHLRRMARNLVLFHSRRKLAQDGNDWSDDRSQRGADGFQADVLPCPRSAIAVGTERCVSRCSVGYSGWQVRVLVGGGGCVCWVRSTLQRVKHTAQQHARYSRHPRTHRCTGGAPRLRR